MISKLIENITCRKNGGKSQLKIHIDVLLIFRKISLKGSHMNTGHFRAVQ